MLARTGSRRRPTSISSWSTRPRPGVTLAQQLTLASDAQYELRFENVRVPASARLGARGQRLAQRSIACCTDGIVLLAAQAIGGAERALEITVDYAKERKQFDKPLGAFQAISHYLADASTRIDGGKNLVYEAAWARVDRPRRGAARARWRSSSPARPTAT